jgi:hypothetical protein
LSPEVFSASISFSPAEFPSMSLSAAAAGSFSCGVYSLHVTFLQLLNFSLLLDQGGSTMSMCELCWLEMSSTVEWLLSVRA